MVLVFSRPALAGAFRKGSPYSWVAKMQIDIKSRIKAVKWAVAKLQGDKTASFCRKTSGHEVTGWQNSIPSLPWMLWLIWFWTPLHFLTCPCLQAARARGFSKGTLLNENCDRWVAVKNEEKEAALAARRLKMNQRQSTKHVTDHRRELQNPLWMFPYLSLSTVQFWSSFCVWDCTCICMGRKISAGLCKKLSRNYFRSAWLS